MEHALINDIAICIVLAWLLAVAAQLLRQPLLIAYLGAGVAIGPVGFRWIEKRESIETISELGLILLLFLIGLEIDLKKMLNAGRIITFTAITQILGGFALGLAFFWACGFPLGGGSLDALYLAVAAAMSSTVIIVKLLYDKRELDTLPGRITLGILVLQDLFAILFLALQPNLKHPSAGLLLWSLGKVVVLVLLAFAVSRYLLPALFRAVAKLPELVLVGALAWCFLVSGFAGYLGLSREMGALVAGVALSTFPYALDVGAKVTSIRDFFVTLFFVSLGMMIPVPTWSSLLWALGFSLFVIGSRIVTVFPPLFTMKMGHRASLLPTLHLCQISELALVILTLGVAARHVSEQLVGILAYAFVFLAIDSTYAILKSEYIVHWTHGWLRRFGLRDLDEEPGDSGAAHFKPRIVLLGFFRTASSLLEEIKERNPALLEELLVVDFNPHVFAKLRERGVRVIYGDIAQRDTLVHAGIPEADTIVCTLSNTILKGATNLKLLKQLRELNSSACIIMHAESAEEMAALRAAGANYVCLPRLLEASDVCSAIEAARKNLLDEKRAAMEETLEDRQEVVA